VSVRREGEGEEQANEQMKGKKEKKNNEGGTKGTKSKQQQQKTDIRIGPEYRVSSNPLSVHEPISQYRQSSF
jgi:hypothetical protein